MDLIASIREDAADAWLPAVYRERVRTQRTRSFDLDVPERENLAEILHTLLGIELKVGRRRFACPDLSTARYLLIFASLGCRRFAVPYDITKISAAADDLWSAWQRSLLLLGSRTSQMTDRSQKLYRARLVKAIRAEVKEIGPGEPMPSFDRETRQRKRQ